MGTSLRQPVFRLPRWMPLRICFCRFGPTRGLDYSLANNLYHLVLGAGFTDANVEIHQPAIIQGENRLFLKWSVEEACPAFVDAGIVTSVELERTLSEMQKAVE